MIPKSWEVMRIAVTGSSGLVGTALVRALRAGGHDVRRLVRRAARAEDEVSWLPDTGLLDGAPLEGVEGVVHLAGESLAAGRWTAARKERLRQSRIEPTRLLSSRLAGLASKPRVLVSASAVGYYGDRGDEWLDETTPAASDFLGRLAADWEAATAPAAEAGIRVVALRLGVVLSPHGGALGRLLLPFRIGVGGRLGPGTQYMSWIAVDDLVAAVGRLLADSSLAGPVNAVAPAPVTNAELTRVLARVLRRPTLAPVPAFALRLGLGEMAEAALLASQRARPARLLAAGFRFRFPELEPALRHLLGRPAA
jgi:hypothetical protein